MKELIKKLAKSKTIQGIAIAALGALMNYGKELLTPEVLAEHGKVITALAAIAEAGGLSIATLGRVVASGPLLTPPATAEKTSFDGTAGER